MEIEMTNEQRIKSWLTHWEEVRDLAECLRMPWAYVHDLLAELAVQGAAVETDNGEWEAV